MCGDNVEQITFRAKLVAKGHRNSSEILSNIGKWLHGSTNDVININGAILRLNKMCNLLISSFGENLCDTDLTMITASECSALFSTPVTLGAIIGGVVTASVMIIIIAIVIITLLYSLCRKRSKRYINCTQS